MNGYADTSFVVSLFASDANTTAATRAVSAYPVTLFWTEWHEFEFTNALCLRQFRGFSNEAQTMAAHQLLSRDIAAGLLTRVNLDHQRVLNVARTIGLSHSSKIGTRSFDVLHVAAAVVLGASYFFTFDLRQAQLARLCGLTVLP